MLDAIAEERTIPAGSGQIRAVRTPQFAEARGPLGTPLEVVRGKGEQSNTAVMFDHRLILKVFRRVEPGINPTSRSAGSSAIGPTSTACPRSPAPWSTTADGPSPTSLAILQELVRNQGNGWEHALHELKGYFERAARRQAIGPFAIDPGRSYLDLAGQEPTAAVKELIGPYWKAAAQLGRRTAELHRALASDPKDPAFAPEPLDPRRSRRSSGLSVDGEFDDGARAHSASHADRLPENCAAPARANPRRSRHGSGSGSSRPEDQAANAVKTRVHGDYHLGQVLRADDDFIILDFEGEPARSVEERRQKRSPLKDVVGMLRSFDYAAFAALFEFTKSRPEEFDRLLPWARLWQTWTSAIFWREYRAVSGRAPHLPEDPAAMSLLLDAYSLDKILYELLYELNNRPTGSASPSRALRR